jgi:hypothetical protein|uniref:Uncharacterized protein n=1 Tax=viral metagenome TaxID=1070528 RepID=A0A6C0BRS7_9ZZZZ
MDTTTTIVVHKINPADEADILETTEVSVADTNEHK